MSKIAVVIISLTVLLALAILFGAGARPETAWQITPHRLPAGGRLEFGSAVVDGRVYLIGGIDAAGNPLNTVDRYDPATGKTETLLELPFALHHASVAAAGTVIYIVGGFAFPDGAERTTFNASNRVFSFDTRNGVFGELASLPEAKAAAGIVHRNGKLYLAGGQDGKFRSQRTAYRYDIAQDAWEPIGSLNYPRNHFPALSGGGYIYAIGGRRYAQAKPEMVVENYLSVEAYDPETNAWRFIQTKMPTGKSGNAGVIVDNRFILVYGGEEYARALRETYILDLATLLWAEGPPLKMPRHGFGEGILIENTLYAIGGSPNYGLDATDTIETLEVDSAEFERAFRK